MLSPCIASGRLNFDDARGRWAISFSENDGVPFTVGTTVLPSIMSEDFNHQVHDDAARSLLFCINSIIETFGLCRRASIYA